MVKQPLVGEALDAGIVIDASGELIDGTRIDGVAGLRQALLAKQDLFVGRLSEKLLTFAIGRGLNSHDRPTVRAVVRDGAGNVSPFSNMTEGTLDFHLGDVAGGAAGTLCDGDNQVSSVDISALGAHYGSTVSTSSSFACLDVGPTFGGTVDGRPVPDGRLSFRDLILYAIEEPVGHG